MFQRAIPQIEYSKPRRLVFDVSMVPPERRHRYLPPEDARALLKGRVVVEEKMDGTQTAFVAENKYVVFAEDLRRKHSVFYKVPGRYAVFDIFDLVRGVFIFPEEKAELSKDIRAGRLRVEGVSPAEFFPVPVVGHGIYTHAELLLMAEAISAYAIDPATRENAHMEGIVIKPDRDLYPEEQLRGKIVRPEFDSDIDEHYLRRPEVRNIIDPRVALVLSYMPRVALDPARFYA